MASKRQQLIEARKASDPIAQLMEREDVDYESDELPTAPRDIRSTPITYPAETEPGKHCPTCTCGDQ
jgi:hypothetical protein